MGSEADPFQRSNDISWVCFRLGPTMRIPRCERAIARGEERSTRRPNGPSFTQPCGPCSIGKSAAWHLLSCAGVAASAGIGSAGRMNSTRENMRLNRFTMLLL